MVGPLIKLIVGWVSCGSPVQQVKRICVQEARSWIEPNDRDGRITKSRFAMLAGRDTRTISSIGGEEGEEGEADGVSKDFGALRGGGRARLSAEQPHVHRRRVRTI